MNYYTITCDLKDDVLVSYMPRCYCALVKRLKTRIKLYVPEANVADKKSFISLAKHVPFHEVVIHYGKVPILDQLGLVQYAELLFDAKAI